ncbi:MAG: phosphate signaling complex protein PhoU [Alphaproteobacteria bacterium]
MSQDHIVKSYDEELNVLDDTLARMGGLAESQIAGALQAIVKRDSELGQRIVAGDQKIDELENEIDAMGIRLLALRQPMAKDLRNIVAAVRIAGDLERVADHAANIAKRAAPLSRVPELAPVGSVPRLSQMVQGMIKDVLDAYRTRDITKARAVWRKDSELDDMYMSLFRELLTYMMEDPRNIGPCLHVVFIAKNIERIGDHATNIAEAILYMVEGHLMTEARPKGKQPDIEVTDETGRE